MPVLVQSISQGKSHPSGHYIVHTPVATLASGQSLMLTTHILVGEQPGKTVGIVSGLHGDEVSTAELLLALIDEVPLSRLAGTLLLVPMANPTSFEWATRSTPQDAKDLNRVFPGNPEGTLTERIAYTICETLLPECDMLIDTHSEPDSMAIRCFYTFRPTDEYSKQSMALAMASGCPIVYAFERLAGSLIETARQRNILAVIAETGGPLPGQDGLMHEAKGEIFRMLHWLEMLPPVSADAVKQPIVVDRETHMRAPVGGLFRPVVGFDVVGSVMDKDKLLGSIVSPYSGECLYELRAPHTESWMMMVRGRTSKVHPGDPLYIVGRRAE